MYRQDQGTARIDQVFAAALAATRAGDPPEAVARYDEVLRLLGEPSPGRASPFTILGRRPGTPADPQAAPPSDARTQQLIVILQEMASVLGDADPPRAHEARRRAIELAEKTGDLDALGPLYTDEARQRLSEIDRDGADAYARAAAQIFAGPERGGGHGRGRVLAARYALDRGDLTQSLRHVEAVLDHAEPRSTPFHDAALLGATIELLYDRPGRALQRVAKARDGAQRAGSLRLVALLDAARGAALCLTGRAEEGEPLVAAAREAVIDRRWTSDDNWVTTLERMVDRVLGRTSAARTILKLATLSGAAPFLPRLARTLTAGVLLALIDRADRTVQATAPEPLDEASPQAPGRTPAARRAAARRAREKKKATETARRPDPGTLAAGDLDLARRALAEAADSAFETPYLRVRRQRLEALIAVHERGPHEGEQLRAVAAECETLGLLGEKARALVALAEARRALQAPTPIRRQPLRRAVEALEQLARTDHDVGLPGLLARARALLDDLPAPLSPPSRQGRLETAPLPQEGARTSSSAVFVFEAGEGEPRSTAGEDTAATGTPSGASAPAGAEPDPVVPDLDTPLFAAPQAGTSIESARALERLRSLYETSRAAQEEQGRLLERVAQELRAGVSVLHELVSCVEHDAPPDRRGRAVARGKRALERLVTTSRQVSDLCTPQAQQPLDPASPAPPGR